MRDVVAMSAVIELLFEDEHVRVLRRQGPAGLTLVTFSNFGFDFSLGHFWGQQLCEREDFAAIGFVAKGNNWFPESSMRAALRAIAGLDLQNVVTYGHSQGGYAALKYASSVRAVGVMACAPQYSIDPKVIPEDRRFSGHFREVLNAGMEIRDADLCGRLAVVMDPADPADAYQLQLIQRACPRHNFFVVPAYHFGHHIMDLMRDRAVVMGLLAFCRGAGAAPDLGAATRRMKRQSWTYILTLSERLSSRKPKVAAEVMNKVLQASGFQVPGSVHLHFSRIASTIYTQAGRSNEILPTLAAIVAANPGNARIKASYEACLVGSQS